MIEGSGMAPVPRALCVLSNTTAIVEAWSRLNTKVRALARRPALTRPFSST